MRRRSWLHWIALGTPWAEAPWAGAVAAASPSSAALRGTSPVRALVFPADHGAHPDSRTEWWYVTGSLTAPGGEAFGFQVTFFRSRTDVPLDHPSRFAASQLVFAHAALSDVAAGRLRHDQRVARAGFGRADAAVGDTRVAIAPWHLARSGPVEASRYRMVVSSDGAGFALDLQAETTQAVMLQGDAGLSRKGPGPDHYSRYYSQPQLRVSGTLQRDGVALAVTGRAWLDHEWSDAYLPPSAVGWDWIGMNLDDGGALMAFRLRRADGSTVWAGGSHRASGAAVRSFGPDEVRFIAGATWRSPATQVRYPVRWRVETPIGSYDVRPRLDAQELDSRLSTGSIYWEGLSDLLDATGRRVGTGYLEMTGYGAPLQMG